MLALQDRIQDSLGHVADEFPVFVVADDAPRSLEQMGSRYKFWFDHPELGRCLYKQPRSGTGEDWAEKVAAELCQLLDIPHARYELAAWRGQRGVISPLFVPDGHMLIHGNELLAGVDPEYRAHAGGSKRYYRVPQHTLDRAMSMMRTADAVPPNWTAQPPIASPADVFTGYLLLDAWIGNTDRHHENWGMLWERPAKDFDGNRVYLGTLRLAPTFDHASSVGSHETDENRQARVLSRDVGYNVEAYARRCVSALYDSESARKSMRTVDAFSAAARQCPDAAHEWLGRLDRVTPAQVDEVLRRVPAALISAAAVEFARALLSVNQRRLVALRGSML